VAPRSRPSAPGDLEGLQTFAVGLEGLQTLAVEDALDIRELSPSPGTPAPNLTASAWPVSKNRVQ